jgi:NTP pyrophosphatase (non-canonical NTP hydrolase)
MGLSQVFDDINEDMTIAYFNQLQGLCWQLAHEKGFHDPREIEGIVRDASAGERLMLIVSEAVEAFESYRAGGGGNAASFYFEVDGKPEGTASEVADIVIRCLDYAAIYDIDLAKVIFTKLRYNATRPHRHGGKTV